MAKKLKKQEKKEEKDKKEEKQENKETQEKKDTGSTKAQILSLNKEIKQLANHLTTNIHDHSSRRGLIKKINKRRKLLKYLRVKNPELYEKMLSQIKKKGKK